MTRTGLQAIADDYLKQRKEEIRVCEGIIEEKVKALIEPQMARPAGADLQAAPEPGGR